MKAVLVIANLMIKLITGFVTGSIEPIADAPTKDVGAMNTSASSTLINSLHAR